MEIFTITNFLEQILINISPEFITGGMVAICIMLSIIFLISNRRGIFFPALMILAVIIRIFSGDFSALTDFQFMEFIPRIVVYFLPKTKPEHFSIESKIINLLKEIKDSTTSKNNNSLSSQLISLRMKYQNRTKDLKQSVIGDGTSNTLTELIKLRNKNVDGLKKIDEHTDKLAETIHSPLIKNMQGLMKELQEIIADQLVEQLQQPNEQLRTQLTEMIKRIEYAFTKEFGEIFKQLNETNQAIKKWQEEYQQQVDQLTEAFEATIEIEEIYTNGESISIIMGQLKEFMGHLDKRLKTFANMKNAIEQSFLSIKEDLDTISINLQKSAEGFSEETKNHIVDTDKQMNPTAEKGKDTVKSLFLIHLTCTIDTEIDEKGLQILRELWKEKGTPHDLRG